MHACLVTPVWHFVVNPRVWGAPALQVLPGPSLDKVGRHQPLMLVRSLDADLIRMVLPPLE